MLCWILHGLESWINGFGSVQVVLVVGEVFDVKIFFLGPDGHGP